MGSLRTLFEKLGDAPPPWLLWIAVVITVSQLLISLYAFRWSVKSELRKRLVDIEDDYWFREVSHPFFVEPLFTFLTDMLGSFEALAIQSDKSSERQTLHNEYLKKFRESKRLLRTRLSFLKASDPNVHVKVSNALMALEDKVTLFCACRAGVGGSEEYEIVKKDEIVELYETTIAACISDLKAHHTKLAKI